MRRQVPRSTVVTFRKNTQFTLVIMKAVHSYETFITAYEIQKSTFKMD
jgi:hypothetical protein